MLPDGTYSLFLGAQLKCYHLDVKGAKKKVRKSDDDFNPFRIAQEISMVIFFFYRPFCYKLHFIKSDDSFTSGDKRSDFESPPHIQSRGDFVGRGAKLEPSEHQNENIFSYQQSLNKVDSIDQDIRTSRFHVKSNGIGKTRSISKAEDIYEGNSNARKPVFKEDQEVDPRKKLGKHSRTNSTDSKGLGGGKSNSLKNLENNDEVFSKIHEKSTLERKLSKFRGPSTIKCFDEHEAFSNNLDYNLLQLSPSHYKVLMATYRLPFKITFNKGETEKRKRWEITLDTNPYMSAVWRLGVEKLKNIIWVGWPVVEVEEEYREELTQILKTEHNAIPIFIDLKIRHIYTEEYCKKFLFHIFYNILEPNANIDQDAYIETYRKVNQLFAEKLLENIDTQTVIIVNDYYLLLTPQYISLKNPKQVIGFMFEASFPTIEFFMMIDHKEEFLCSLLCCDLICFSTGEYVKSFFSICAKLFNLRYNALHGGYLYVSYYGRRIFVGVAKHAIEAKLVAELAEKPQFAQACQTYRQKYPESNLMLTVTQFHRYEGLMEFLSALQTYFTTNLDKKFTMVFLQVHGRLFSDELPYYSEYKAAIKEKIGKINTDLAALGSASQVDIIENWTPHECYALMSLASIFFSFSVSLTSDLKVLEYVILREKGPAAVVRSEWTFGQKNLNIVRRANPSNAKRVITAISEILKTPCEDQEFVLKIDKKIVENHSAWRRFEHVTKDLANFLTIKSSLCLLSFKEIQGIKLIAAPEKFKPLNFEHIKKSFARAKNRVVILNHENVLMDIEAYERTLDPRYESQYVRNISKDHLEVLKKFSKKLDGQLNVISSKRAEFMNYLYEVLPNISVFAENGFLYKVRKESTWHQLFAVDWSFKTIVHKIMQNYAARTEGVRIEKKESAIYWSCINVGTNIGEIQVEELKLHLKEVLEFLDYVEILSGNTWIEVKPTGINKVSKVLLFPLTYTIVYIREQQSK